MLFFIACNGDFNEFVVVDNKTQASKYRSVNASKQVLKCLRIQAITEVSSQTKHQEVAANKSCFRAYV